MRYLCGTQKTNTMKLLIVYGTTEGQTRKIAEYIKADAEKAGVQVTLCDATQEPIRPDGYQAAIICASMHMHKYQTSIANYIKVNIGALNEMPSAFISVSLTAAGDNEESWKELREVTAHFMDYMEWKPTLIEQVAGALRYTEYDFLKKYIMRMIAQKAGGQTSTDSDCEYTDWKQVSAFTDEFLQIAKRRAMSLTDEIA